MNRSPWFVEHYHIFKFIKNKSPKQKWTLKMHLWMTNQCSMKANKQQSSWFAFRRLFLLLLFVRAPVVYLNERPKWFWLRTFLLDILLELLFFARTSEIRRNRLCKHYHLNRNGIHLLFQFARRQSSNQDSIERESESRKWNCSNILQTVFSSLSLFVPFWPVFATPPSHLTRFWFLWHHFGNCFCLFPKPNIHLYIPLTSHLFKAFMHPSPTVFCSRALLQYLFTQRW